MHLLNKAHFLEVINISFSGQANETSSRIEKFPTFLIHCNSIKTAHQRKKTSPLNTKCRTVNEMSSLKTNMHHKNY